MNNINFSLVKLQLAKESTHADKKKIKVKPSQAQGSQYCTGTSHTSWYVPYQYVYRYQNINISYRFKYQPYRPISSVSTGIKHTGRYQKKKAFYFLGMSKKFAVLISCTYISKQNPINSSKLLLHQKNYKYNNIFLRE